MKFEIIDRDTGELLFAADLRNADLQFTQTAEHHYWSVTVDDMQIYKQRVQATEGATCTDVTKTPNMA